MLISKRNINSMILQLNNILLTIGEIKTLDNFSKNQVSPIYNVSIKRYVVRAREIVLIFYKIKLILFELNTAISPK